MKRVTALLIIGFFAFSNCDAMKPKTITITLYRDLQKTIRVDKGDTLLVKLPMASGTGFVWQVSGKTNFCKQGDIKYEHIKSSMPGAPLMETMSFTMRASGVEDIIFIYHRPFEKNKAAAKTRRLHLIVR
jgi:predicted secreted protein